MEQIKQLNYPTLKLVAKKLQLPATGKKEAIATRIEAYASNDLQAVIDAIEAVNDDAEDNADENPSTDSNQSPNNSPPPIVNQIPVTPPTGLNDDQLRMWFEHQIRLQQLQLEQQLTLSDKNAQLQLELQNK